MTEKLLTRAQFEHAVRSGDRTVACAYADQLEDQLISLEKAVDEAIKIGNSARPMTEEITKMLQVLDKDFWDVLLF